MLWFSAIDRYWWRHNMTFIKLVKSSHKKRSEFTIYVSKCSLVDCMYNKLRCEKKVPFKKMDKY